jgi:hypothetical protein
MGNRADLLQAGMLLFPEFLNAIFPLHIIDDCINQL